MCVCMFKSVFFIYSSIDGHIDYFHVLATVSNATVNMGVWISFGVADFVYLE